MQLHQAAHQRQADAHATVAAHRGAGGAGGLLLKTVEQERQQLGLDALAGVGYAELQKSIALQPGHADLATHRREPDGVAEQNTKHLLEPHRVAQHRVAAGAQHRAQADALGSSLRQGGVDGGGDNATKFGVLHVQLKLPGFDAVHVQQVFDQLHLQPRVA